MTAIQILEKLGADASFTPNNLSAEDTTDIEQTLSNSKPFNAVQIHNPPDEEAPSEDEEKEKEKEKEA